MCADGASVALIELIGLGDSSPVLQMPPLESQLHLMAYDILGKV